MNEKYDFILLKYINDSDDIIAFIYENNNNKFKTFIYSKSLKKIIVTLNGTFDHKQIRKIEVYHRSGKIELDYGQLYTFTIDYGYSRQINKLPTFLSSHIKFEDIYLTGTDIFLIIDQQKTVGYHIYYVDEKNYYAYYKLINSDYNRVKINMQINQEFRTLNLIVHTKDKKIQYNFPRAFNISDVKMINLPKKTYIHNVK